MNVCVVVPARDEGATIALLLESLREQSRQPGRTIVVDAGSEDGTETLARHAGGERLAVIPVGPAFPGQGRNVGALVAREEWIAFIDAGCTADSSWLNELLAAADAAGPSCGAVFGTYDPIVDSEWAVAQALVLVPPESDGCRPMFIASSLVSRKAWREAGGFPEDLRAAEDLVFFDRLRQAGIGAVRAPRARIRWRMAASPAATFRRLRLYSAHHWAAGLARTWHVRVVAMDVAGLALLGLGIRWAPAVGVLAAGLAARLLRAVWPRRRVLPGFAAWRPDRLARGLAVLALADLATWVGLFDQATRRMRRCP